MPGVNWRVAILLVLAIAALLPTTRGEDPKGGADPARPIDPEQFDAALLAREIHRVTNEARVNNGLRRLRSLRALSAAADDQASMMALRLHCGHSNPLRGQRNPYDRVERHGLRPYEVGENVAAVPLCDPATGKPRTYAEQAQLLVEAWLNSPGHRENLLKGRFRGLGCAARIACVPIGQQMVFAAQVFYSPE